MTVVDQKMTVFRTHSHFGICTTMPDYVSINFDFVHLSRSWSFACE
jgi:hypothetical protein